MELNVNFSNLGISTIAEDTQAEWKRTHFLVRLPDSGDSVHRLLLSVHRVARSPAIRSSSWRNTRGHIAFTTQIRRGFIAVTGTTSTVPAYVMPRAQSASTFC